MNLVLQLFLVAFCGIIFFQFPNGALTEVAERSCASLVAEITKRQLSGIASCTKKLKLKTSKEKTQKQACILKCIMKKEGFLTDKGQIAKDKLEQMLETEVPPSLRKKIEDTFKPCVEKELEMVLDDSDEFCKDFQPMIKCLLRAFPNMCK